VGQPQVAQLSVKWDTEEGAYDGLHGRANAAQLAPAVGVDLQLEAYANGRQALVWMWMPILAIVHRRGGEAGFPHSPSAGAALAHKRYMCTP